MSGTHLSATARYILECFRDDYPSSAQVRGGRKLRKGGWDRIFPRIHTDPEVKEAFLAAAEELEALGVLSIRWARYRRGDRIEALFLEDPALLYSLSGLPTPEQQREEALGLLQEFRERVLQEPDGSGEQGRDDTRGQSGEFIRTLVEHLEARIEAYIPTPCGDPQRLRELLLLLETDRELIAELPIRALSIRLFRDSKRLEGLLAEADKLALSAAGERISSRLELSRSYPQAGLRGEAELLFTDGRTWNLNGEELFCGKRCVERLSLIAVGAPVLVVENKETFMTLQPERCGFSALLYGGGHLNRATAALLQLLERSGAELYYFGDLDPEGLLIFQETDELLSGRLIPWHMDVPHYLHYLDYGYPLSEQLLSRLDRLRPGRFDELAALLRSNRIGVEQELMGAE